MTWLTFHKFMWLFDWIIPLFRRRHLTHKGPCHQNIRRTVWARIMIFAYILYLMWRWPDKRWQNSVISPFSDLCRYCKATLSTKYLENRLSKDHDIRPTFWLHAVDDNINFHKILWIFDRIIVLFRLRHLTHKGHLSTTYLENCLS